MKKDKKEAKLKGLDVVQLEDDDFSEYKKTLQQMKEIDNSINDDLIEENYKNRRVQPE